MANRALIPREAEQVSIRRGLSDRELTILTRQSTTFQALNNQESMELQLSDALSWAENQGFAATSIRVRQEGGGKRGVSGTLRIDQRQELRETLADIKAAPKGTMAIRVYSISRLFRDPSGSQVGAFIEVCTEYDALVVTSDKVYDFCRNSDDAFMFKLLASLAAKENQERTKLLHAANRKVSERGEYDGRPLTPGFIVDRDKQSPTYGRFIPYKPHSEVVARLYARYHQLGGAFNLLASEVAKVPVLFPDFESWVDAKNVSKLLLKKVPGGYTLTRNTLFRLLTSLEVAGYWVTGGTDSDGNAYREVIRDEQGQPKINHEAIVDMGDWLYAFNSLSWVTLSGDKNTGRTSQRTWIPARRAEAATLLQGILTSPLGLVQVSGEYYRVAEQRPGNLHRSNTLSLGTAVVDGMFMDRLQDRYIEAGMKPYDRIIDELIKVRANNAVALVSVEEQIAQYEKSIAGKQAVMAALGTEIDLETARKYNQDIKNDRAQLNALIAKRDTAAVEESQLRELHEKIDQVLIGEFKDKEVLRRFIKLAVERIEIDEVSGHFATLTVTWRAPFAQTDIGYIYRKEPGHQVWASEEDELLRVLYPSADRLEVMQALPMRSWQAIKIRAGELEPKVVRETRLNSSDITDTSLSLEDVEIIERLGHNPKEGYIYADMWFNDVSVSTSRRTEHQARCPA